MPYLQENEWLLLNDIIFKIHSIEDNRTMRQAILDALGLIIPFNFAAFYMSSDTDDRCLSDPVAVNIPEEELDEWYQFESCDYLRWTYLLGKSMVCNETDMFTDSQREQSEYYRTFYAPRNIHYALLLSIALNGEFLGIISLYRMKSEDKFLKRDAFVLEQLKIHLSYRLNRDRLLKYNEGRPTGAASGKAFEIEKVLVGYGLTLREIEIYGLVIQGLSNKALSDELFISLHTVKKHLKSIYRKLGVKNRLEAIIKHKELRTNACQ